MQGPSVLPTAPPGMQVQVPEGSGDGKDPAGGAGQVTSPLGKMKNKAKKLRDKIKKVTSPTTSPGTHDPGDLNKKNQAGDFPPQPPQHQRDDVGGGADSHEDDEEDDIPEGDQHSMDQGGDAAFQARSPVEAQADASQSKEDYEPAAEDQPKQDQARSFDAVAKPDDGAEGEVHDGIPASTIATGAYGRPQDNKPISPFKNDGPPGALQATPTEYHYPPEDDQISADPGYDLSPGQSKPKIEDVTESGPPSEDRGIDTGYDLSPGQSKPKIEDVTESGAPSAEEDRGIDTSDRLSDKIASRDYASSGQMSPMERDMNLPYPEDIVKPNPDFGQSASPIHKKIAVINEDLPAEARADAGLAPDSFSSSPGLSDEAVPENAPLNFDPEGKADTDISKASPAGVGLLADEERPSEIPEQDKRQDSSRDYSSSQGISDRSLPEDIDREGTVDDNESKTLPENLSQQKLGEFASTGGYGQAGGEDEPQVRQTVPEPELQEINEPEERQTIAGDSQKPLFTSLAGEENSADEAEAFPVDDSTSKQQVPGSSDRMLPTALAKDSPDSYAESGSDSGGRAFGAHTPEVAAGAGAAAAAVAATAAAAHDEGGSRGKDDEADQSMIDQVNKSPGSAIGQDTTDDYAEDRGNEGFSDAASGDGKEQLLGDPVAPGERASMDKENRGKWAADKPDSLKDGSTSDLPGIGDASKGVDTVNGVSPGGQEAEEREDEYFDPTNDTDNQFQEGFTHGTEEADKEPSSGGVTGSTMDKLSGLTATVGSSLGLSRAARTDAPPTDKGTEATDVSREADNIPSPGTGIETERSGIDGSENVPSPSVDSERPEQPSIPEGMKDVAAAGLGYDERKTSPVPSENTTEPAIPRENDLKDDAQGSQQSSGGGGALQGLRDAFSSRFGYGSPKGSNIPSPGTGTGTETERAGIDGSADNVPSPSMDSERPEQADNVPSPSMDSERPEQASIPKGIKDVAAAGLGYEGKTSSEPSENTTEPAIPRENDLKDDSLGSQQSSGGGGALQGLRDAFSSRFGYGSPKGNENADGNLNDQQQTDGVGQGLKNAAATKMGYEGSVQDRSDDRPPQDEATFGEEPSEAPVEEQPQPRKDVIPPSTEAAGQTDYPSVDTEEQPPAPPEERPALEQQERTDSPKVDKNIPAQPQTGGTLQGLNNVAAKLGYGSPRQDPEVEDPAHDASSGERAPISPPQQSPISPPQQPPPAPTDAKPPGPPGEEEDGKNSTTPSSYAQKFFSTAAAAKDYLWSPKAGAGKQEPAADDSAEVESPASVV